MGVIYFNGVSSTDIGIEVESYPQYEIPEKNVTVYEIPGRNGNIVVDTNTFKNAKSIYDVSFLTNDGEYNLLLHKIAAWLYSPSGYARLEDSYDLDHYRLARMSSGVNFENIFNKAGRGTLEFDCKPQRFLKIGEKIIPIKIDSSSNSKKKIELYNPTLFSAKPLIKIYNQSKTNASYRLSALLINDITIKFSDLIPDASKIEYDSINIIIDFEYGNAYYCDSTNSANKQYALSSYAYSKLFNNGITFGPGYNNITISLANTSANDVVYVEIIPRWWTL